MASILASDDERARHALVRSRPLPGRRPRRGTLSASRELTHATIWLGLCLVGGSLALIVTYLVSPPGTFPDTFPLCQSTAIKR